MEESNLHQNSNIPCVEVMIAELDVVEESSQPSLALANGVGRRMEGQKSVMLGHHLGIASKGIIMVLRVSLFRV